MIPVQGHDIVVGSRGGFGFRPDGASVQDAARGCSAARDGAHRRARLDRVHPRRWAPPDHRHPISAHGGHLLDGGAPLDDVCLRPSCGPGRGSAGARGRALRIFARVSPSRHGGGDDGRFVPREPPAPHGRRLVRGPRLVHGSPPRCVLRRGDGGNSVVDHQRHHHRLFFFLFIMLLLLLLLLLLRLLLRLLLILLMQMLR